MNTPVTITIDEINGDRRLEWTRTDRYDIDDPGTWDGAPDWITAADSALTMREPIVVAEPGLLYEFADYDGGIPVEEVAAAMIYAAGARGDCAQAVAELPPDLFDDDDLPPGAIF